MVDHIIEQQKLLVRTLKEKGASIVGFGNVSSVDSELTRKFPVAISLGVKYDEEIVEDLQLNEESFHNHLVELNVPLMRLISTIENLLSQWSYQYTTVPISIPIKDSQQLRELQTFSHKAAATSAGLGWIGKSSLLVTPEYGPRIRLGTVLTNAPFPMSEPIFRDKCGKCSLCVEACPYGAINNVNWERGIAREKLIDAYVCNEKRLEYIPIIGRKHSCGLCIQACKIGKDVSQKYLKCPLTPSLSPLGRGRG